jgi:Asp-tRNA(Asn)/Glu-tRNA(Gln) amidotransferase C subunit
VQEVAGADVPPTSHPIPVNNVVREDVVVHQAFRHQMPYLVHQLVLNKDLKFHKF